MIRQYIRETIFYLFFRILLLRYYFTRSNARSSPNKYIEILTDFVHTASLSDSLVIRSDIFPLRSNTPPPPF